MTSPPVFLWIVLLIQVIVVKSYWIPPRKPLHENRDYSNESVAKIHSDFDTGKGNILYFLEGVGASEAPFMFSVDHSSGLITLIKTLDREQIDTYHLKGVAKYATTMIRAEEDVPIRFKVVDENDNPPVFHIIRPGAVNEHSPRDTVVLRMNVTDADEPGNDNSKIRYSLIGQNPPGDLFYITGNGIICVKDSALDREKTDKYFLTVKAQDLDGRPGGNVATATVTINVNDVNDNLPTLEKDKYEGNIEENTQGVEVMRLKVNDMDLMGTENWEAVFNITEGNEAGYFSIKTDAKTNEGILMLDKAVDYEDVQDLDLKIAVRNKAAAFLLRGGKGESESWPVKGLKTYPVKINVKNKPEGPAFDPKTQTILISEGGNTVSINKVIARYPAIDGDTRKPAKNVRYAKGADPDNWLIIDPETAEIKLNKIPDRESKYLKDGTYYANVLCISEDEPGKTATGTVAIQVEDFNDHCPTLTSTYQSMCTSANHVIVNAKDEDLYPNGPPFDFKILPDGTEGKWKVERLNDTAAILRAQETKWPGIYKVAFEVRDEQGQACPEPQKLEVQVCTCEDGVMCGKRGSQGQLAKTSAFGPAGIGLLFLGLLMLLLIPLLLLFCRFGSAAEMTGAFAEMPFDTKSHLVNYRTEGQGENTAVPLLIMPTAVDGDIVKIDEGTKTSAMVPMEQQSVASMDGMNVASYDDGYYRERTWGAMNKQHGNGFYSEFQGRGSATGVGFFEGMALPNHILADYYNQKLASGYNHGAEDSPLVHSYEGQGSPAGSVASLSNLGSDNDLQFLDDLGPKFKTLAGLCGGKKIETEVNQVIPPTQTSVSSLMTTHTLPPLPQPQPTIPKAEHTVVRETVKESTVREGMTTVKEGMANQGQTLLLQQQQPVYYTTTPVLQPMHYVVQPQVQNTMLLAEAPATNLQGMVLVNGTQTMSAQGMVVQGQPMMSTAQVPGHGVVLVGGGGVHTGIPSGSQTMMVLEGKVPAGSMKVLKGSQSCLVQGATLQQGGLSGSQIILEGKVPAGSMKVQKGSQTSLVQGATIQPGNLSGSQILLEGAGSMKVIKGGQTTLVQGGTLEPRGLSGSQRVLVVGGPTSVEGQLGGPSAGSKSSIVSSSTMTAKATPTYSKTVVREKFTEL